MRLRRLIVVDQRAVVRGCLCALLTNLGQNFDIADVADVEQWPQPSVVARADAVILSANAPSFSSSWIERQVAWLRAYRAEVPIIAIIDDEDSSDADLLASRFGLQGYISTSESLEIAVAALRLVLAGGNYVPRCSNSNGAAANPGRRNEPPAPSVGVKLTPRESDVMDLLERGMPNKLIAFRLGMSQSTVKVHVHSIISKLKVRNRTEAAVAGRCLQPIPATTNGS